MFSWQMAKGFVAARMLLRQAPERAFLSTHIIGPRVQAATTSAFTKRVVLLVGFSCAGKSHFRRSHPDLQDLVCIETDVLHAELNALYPDLQENTAIHSHAFWKRQFLTHWVRGQLCTELIRRDIAFVVDACNLDRWSRLAITKQAHQRDFDTSIVWVQPHPLVHYDRLRAADDDRESRGLPRTWYELVMRQRFRFEPPFTDEANRIITHFGGAPIESVSL